MLNFRSLSPQSQLLQSIVVQPLTIAPDRPVIEAIALMNAVPLPVNGDDRSARLQFQARSGCVAIVEHGKPIGVITERDVVRLSAKQQDSIALAVRQVMSANFITLAAAKLTDLSMALDLLDRQNIDRLFIIDRQGETIGLVTRELLQAKTIELANNLNQWDRSLDLQVERELVLREIGQKVRRSLELPIVFETAVREIRSFLATDRVEIFKFGNRVGFERGKFVAESVAAGVEPILGLKIYDPNFGSKLASYYQKGGINVVENIRSAGLLDDEVEILSKFQVRANLVVPLLAGDRLWGLLCLHQCLSERTWQESEISFVKQIAEQIGIAIQQANLFKRLQSELTERERAEIQLRQTNEELARATQLKDEFLANMSHELRTPLNAVLGLAEGLAASNFGAVNERQQRALATIEKSGRHLLALINDILDLSKIEAKQLNLELTEVAISSLCKNSVLFVKELAHKQQIPVSIAIPEHLQHLTLRVDDLRFRQILINLLSNAIKFTPTGGQVTLGVEVIDRAIGAGGEEKTARYITFSVSDTGIGIAPENLSKLFQSFVQIDSSLNRQYAGTGLGLALVKRLAELHGGSVSVSSEVDRGSCFTVYLPFELVVGTSDLASRSPISGDLGVAEAVPAIRAKALVLIADDNEANMETMTGYLQTRGYRLLEATTGRQAIELAVAHHPDIILMDIQMPDMDGLEAISAIRQLPEISETIVAAVTALAMPTDRQKCLDAGANIYITKPVKLGQLVATIEKLLHGE